LIRVDLPLPDSPTIDVILCASKVKSISSNIFKSSVMSYLKDRFLTLIDISSITGVLELLVSVIIFWWSTNYYKFTA